MTALLCAALSTSPGWSQIPAQLPAQMPGTLSTSCTTVTVPPSATVTVVNRNPQVVRVTSTSQAQPQRGPTPTILDAIAFPNAHLVGSAIPTPGTASQPVLICQGTPGQLPQVPVYPYSPGFGYSYGYGYGYGSESTSVTYVPGTPSGYNGSTEHATPPITNATVPSNSIRDLAHAPDLFDREVVTVTGVVAAVRVAATAGGTPYTALTLREGDAAVGVLIWGRPGLAQGDAVRVSGSFYAGTPPAFGVASSSLSWVQADAIASIAHL